MSRRCHTRYHDVIRWAKIWIEVNITIISSLDNRGWGRKVLIVWWNHDGLITRLNTVIRFGLFFNDALLLCNRHASTRTSSSLVKTRSAVGWWRWSRWRLIVFGLFLIQRRRKFAFEFACSIRLEWNFSWFKFIHRKSVKVRCKIGLFAHYCRQVLDIFYFPISVIANEKRSQLLLVVALT